MEQAVTAYVTVLLLIKTIMYGFTTLITLVVMANLVNTIFTGIL